MIHRYLLFLLLVVDCYTATAQNLRLVPIQYPTIQKALDACREGDVVSVSEGVYYENLVWPRSIKGIKLVAHGRMDSTIIDGRDSSRVIGMYNWNSDIEIDSNTIIQGFTIRNGRVEEDRANGAGLLIYNASPLLRNLKVENNQVIGERAYGGGIYIEDSTCKINNCIIQNNNCISDSWANGGGLYARESKLKIDECIIKNNLCDSDRWAYGAGIKTWESELIIFGSSFIGNSTYGGGWSQGAGLHLDGFSDSQLYFRIESCYLEGNHSSGSRPYGGAIDFGRSTTTDVVNTVFLANRTSTINWRGSIISLNESELNIINCTFAFNDEGIDVDESSISIINSIMWDNGTEITLNPYRDQNSLVIDNSLIKGGVEGYDVLNVMPQFYGKYDLRLRRDSPCLDTGSPYVYPENDILGNPRPMPFGSRPDIGAYEMNYSDSKRRSSGNNQDVTVYPNPSSGPFYFSGTIDEIKIFSSGGNLILKDKGVNRIDLYGFPPGEYFVLLNNKTVKKLTLVK